MIRMPTESRQIKAITCGVCTEQQQIFEPGEHTRKIHTGPREQVKTKFLFMSGRLRQTRVKREDEKGDRRTKEADVKTDHFQAFFLPRFDRLHQGLAF